MRENMLNRKLCRDGHELERCMYEEVLQDRKAYPTPVEYPVMVVWHEEYELEYGRMLSYDYIYISEFPAKWECALKAVG